MSPISSKATVAQCDLLPISSNRRVVHGVFHTFWLPKNTGQFEAKRQLRRVFWRKFWATGQLRTVFCTGQLKAKRQLRSVSWGQFRATARLRTVFWTSFSFLRNVAHFKQNDSCAVWFGANFEQQESCSRRFTGFSFLTIRANFKQNDSCAVRHRANFEQQQGCARCFRQV